MDMNLARNTTAQAKERRRTTTIDVIFIAIINDRILGVII
jgi:hypothetical protein